MRVFLASLRLLLKLLITRRLVPIVVVDASQVVREVAKMADTPATCNHSKSGMDLKPES